MLLFFAAKEKKIYFFRKKALQNRFLCVILILGKVLIVVSRIAILGSGSWGCALAHTLSGRNHVIIWSYFPEETEALLRDRENKNFLPGVILKENITFTSDIKEAVQDAEFIVFAVPSFAIRSTAKSVAPFFDANKQIAVCVAKGLEEDTLFTLTELIEDELPKGSHVCALSGPTHAEEVGRDLPTTIVAACSEEEVSLAVQYAFMNENFRIYTSTDSKGVELGGTVKNIIALCAGISDGCGFGDNAKAALMTRGMHEIAKLGVAMGGKVETFYGLSGMGDLIVTCTSQHSRNRRCGMLIGKGIPPEDAMREVNMVVEGIKCLKAVKKASEKFGVSMPITEEAYKIVYEGKNPRESAIGLMSRDKKAEKC